MANARNAKEREKSSTIPPGTWKLSPCPEIVTCNCPELPKLEPLARVCDKYPKRDLDATIKKLAELVTDPTTSGSVPRIRRLLYDYLRMVDDNGHRVKHLTEVMQVLEFLAGNVAEYQDHMDRMLELCCSPPLLEKTSESLFCAEVLEQYFTLLGYLLVILPARQSMKIHEAIGKLLARTSPVSIRAVKLELCHRAVEKSRLPITLTQLLEICAPDALPKILDLTFLLASVSHACCHRLLEAGVMNEILRRLDSSIASKTLSASPRELPENEPGSGDSPEVLVLVTNIMWSLLRSILSLERLPPNLTDLSSPSICAMRGLRYAFRREVLSCFRNGRRSLTARNDLAAIILAGLVAMPAWKLTESGLADDLAVLVAATELGTEGTWAESVKFTNGNEDFLFKKILLLSVCYLAPIEACNGIMVKRRVMDAVLQLINPRTRDFDVLWTPSQYWHLLRYALRTLTTLLPKMPKQFVACRGSHRLLMVVEWSLTVEFDVDVVMECAKTVCSVVSLDNSALRDDFRKQGLIDTLIRLVHYLLDFDSWTMQHQRIVTFAVIALENLIAGKPYYQEAYGSENLRTVIRLLTRCRQQRRTDFLLDQRLLIALGTFIWECIVWCPKNLEDFVKTDATYIMLDVVESASFLARTVFLGVLSDMCEGAFIGPYLCTWRGTDKSRGFLSFLTRTWREEEARIGVRRTPDGCIEDLELPLMGNEQWLNTYHPRSSSAHKSSPALAQAMTSCRFKIYSIRKSMLRNKEHYEMAREHYKILLDDLPVEDQITMCIIDHYLKLTLGEVWVEVARSLEQVGVTPLGMDGQLMFLMIQRYRGGALFVKKHQEGILKAAREKEIKREKEEYARIREAKLLPALDALKEMDFIRRTTDREYMLLKRRQQKEQVNAALRFPPDADASHCHRTFFEKGNVTAVLEQKQIIRSVQLPENDQMDVLPVSPASSGVATFRSSLRSTSLDEAPSCCDCFVADVRCSHGNLGK